MAFYPPNGTAQQLLMTENVQLDYPYSSDSNNVIVTDIIDVTATADSLKITLPNSQLTSPGFSIAFNNVGLRIVKLFLYDSSTVLYALSPGNAISTYLYDNSTSSGEWRVVETGGGTSAISNLDLESSNNSIDILGGDVSSPGGTVDFTLPSIIGSISSLSAAAPGVVVVNPTEESSWDVNLLGGGSNITVVNGDSAISGAPIEIALNDPMEISRGNIGDIVIADNLITNSIENENLVLSSNGNNSTLDLNGVAISTSGDITGIRSLSTEEVIEANNIAKVWCVFTNTSGTIASVSTYNVGSITFDSATGQYTISFDTPLTNTNYAVFISCSNTNSESPVQTRIGYDIIKQLDSVTIILTDSAGEMLVDIPEGVSVTIYSTT